VRCCSRIRSAPPLRAAGREKHGLAGAKKSLWLLSALGESRRHRPTRTNVNDYRAILILERKKSRAVPAFSSNGRDD